MDDIRRTDCTIVTLETDASMVRGEVSKETGLDGSILLRCHPDTAPAVEAILGALEANSSTT